MISLLDRLYVVPFLVNSRPFWFVSSSNPAVFEISIIEASLVPLDSRTLILICAGTYAFALVYVTVAVEDTIL